MRIIFYYDDPTVASDEIHNVCERYPGVKLVSADNTGGSTQMVLEIELGDDPDILVNVIQACESAAIYGS